MMNFIVTLVALHAERQSHEMEDVRDMLTELGVEPIMSDASAARLQWLAAKNLKGKFLGRKPDTWEEVVQAWS